MGHRTTEMTPGRESLDGALAARTDVALQLRAEADSNRSIDASVLVLDERQRWRTGTFFNFGDNRQYSGRVRGSWQAGRAPVHAHDLHVTVRSRLACERAVGAHCR